VVQIQRGQIVPQDPILKKPITKKGLVEWLKMKALSSNHSTAKKITKRAGGVTQGVHPEFKSQYHKKSHILIGPSLDS
jgi:hypothetical protein